MGNNGHNGGYRHNGRNGEQWQNGRRSWEQLPERLPLHDGQRLIKVYVEGYEDVAFWRSVFDDYESSTLIFEISVPPRDDLAKGKKIVLRMATSKGPEADTLYCVDSDFDYLFADQTPLAQLINNTPYIFHTYAYATENYLCYAPSLHNLCVKATKNDARIFDFERFFRDYSRTIFPLFLWYAYSAQINSPSIFPLQDFKSNVKINYLEVDDNGADTLEWLRRQVDRKLKTLRAHHGEIEKHFPAFSHLLKTRGVTPDNTYLFMQGHTLMDNVAMPVLDAVCDKLRQLSLQRIGNSQRHGVTLANEQSNYKNSMQDIRNALLFNENYKDCYLYAKVKTDIESYLQTIE